MARVKRINLVNDHKEAAESYLKFLQDEGKIPAKISGVVSAKFGKYINIWQYRNNVLVGAVALNVNNVQQFHKKLDFANASIDWSGVFSKMENKEPDEEPEEESEEQDETQDDEEVVNEE